MLSKRRTQNLSRRGVILGSRAGDGSGGYFAAGTRKDVDGALERVLDRQVEDRVGVRRA